MSNIAKRISAVALSVVLALGMCPAVALAAPAADAQEPQAVEAVAPETAASEAATPEATAPEATPAAEEPVTLEATASEEGPELAAAPARQVRISKTMKSYSVDMNGSKTLVTSVSGAANQARDCGEAGYCQLVSPSDGSAATTFPKVGALEAFTLGSANGYKLAAFNVTYTDKATGRQVKWTNKNGLTRLGSYSALATTYEFTVPDADDVTVNAVWERQVTSIAKTLASPLGTTSESQCEAGTCTMVATQSGIPATKYPVVGNQTAFRIVTKSGYKLSTFNVAYTDKATGKQVKLTNGQGLTRTNKTYSATSNTYEFKVPEASDVSVNVTWDYAQAPRKISYGNEGGNINWELYSNGLLTMTGTGDMPNYYELDINGDISAGYIQASRHLNVPITSVKIGEGITGIGNRAFYGKTELKSVSLPSTLTSISDEAFTGCGLTGIEFPKGLKTIGYGAFSNTALTSVVIPDGVQTIGGSAFGYCPNLKTVKIGEGLQTLGGTAFAGCANLTSVTLPNSLKFLDDSMFVECVSLTTFNVPAGIEKIDPWAFRECPNLKSFTVDKANANIYSPDGRCLVMKSGPLDTHYYNSRPDAQNVLCAYANASGSTYTIPSSVEAIASFAFNFNDTLKSVTIPTSVKTIYNSAFSQCNGLTTVTIPKSVTYLGESSFSSCYNLSTAYVPTGLSLSTWYPPFPSTCNVIRY